MQPHLSMVLLIRNIELKLITMWFNDFKVVNPFNIAAHTSVHILSTSEERNNDKVNLIKYTECAGALNES